MVRRGLFENLPKQNLFNTLLRYVSVIMDVAPVQSGGKSGSSDFSIERILSDGRKEESEAPSWLCCTRYQPPRIPRAVSSGAGRGRRAGRHARVPFTATQAAALEGAYARAPYLAPPALRALAAALQLRDDRIKIWFQNRRARERREKCSTITPPHAIALPPTTTRQGTLVTRNPWISRTIPALTPESSGYSGTNIPHDLSRSTSLFYNSSISEDSDENRAADGSPESPLDVETVED